MENMIISLDQVSPGHWQAKYRGNYGIYKIRIQLDANKLVSFSCSCPSDNYPCKHIEIVVEEIEMQSPILERESKEVSTSIKEILQKISHNELKDFVIHYSTYNEDFLKKIQLEFLGKLEKVKETNYSALLKKALKKVHFDYDDLYDNYDSTIEVDIINDWLKKAEAFILQSRFDEAVAILKAIINEYAEWTETIENDILEYIDPDYREKPFDLLLQIARINQTIANELFEYAITEIHNPIHNESGNGDRFSDLLLNIANSKEQISRFLELQDELINQVENKASYEAEKILSRIILFYQKNNAPDKVAKLIEDNLQIISFRKQYLERKIAEGNFALAKKKLNDSLIDRNTTSLNSHWEWNKMLLFIAGKEGDLATVRKLAFTFIETNFNQEYYRLFKSTFPAIEWPDQLKKIIRNYEKDDRYFSTSKANVLVEENNSNELISYIGKHLSVERLENYYSFFSKDFPGETLDLFYKAINNYAERNTGRNHYDYIVRLLMKMKHIEGGKEKVSAMVMQFKILYKNRRAMMEIFQRAKI